MSGGSGGITEAMDKSIAGYNPFNLFILIILDYSKIFTTNKVLTIGLMPMFEVKSIVIQINGLAYGSINGGLGLSLGAVFYCCYHWY